MNLWSYIFFQLLPDYLPRIILSGAIIFVILCKPGIMKKVYKKMGHSQKTNILYRIIFAVLILLLVVCIWNCVWSMLLMILTMIH